MLFLGTQAAATSVAAVLCTAAEKIKLVLGRAAAAAAAAVAAVAAAAAAAAGGAAAAAATADIIADMSMRNSVSKKIN